MIPRKNTYGWRQYSADGPKELFQVKRCDGALCYASTYDWETKTWRDPTPFIWSFKNGLNALHWWPGKPPGREVPSPGWTPDFSIAARPEWECVVLEQAAYYNMTPEEHATLVGSLVEAEEIGLLTDSEGNAA